MASEFEGRLGEARRAEKTSRLWEAAQHHHELRRMAKSAKEAIVAYRLGLDELTNWHMSGHPDRTLSILIELTAEPPPDLPVLLQWWTKFRHFEFLRCYRPNVASMRRRLDDLRDPADRHSALPRSVALRAEATFLRARGLHDQALRLIERAWACRQDGGLQEYIYLHNAAYSALCLGRRTEALQWHHQPARYSEQQGCSGGASCDIQMRLALWDMDRPALSECVHRLSPHAHPQEQSIWWRRPALLRVRALLLEEMQGDPGAPCHPGWIQLKRKPRAKPEIEERYGRVLLVLDYRLACLRYAIGLPPEEDLFHRDSQRQKIHQTSTRRDWEEIRRRIRKARGALASASRVARSQDLAFESAWRQRELEGRQERLQELDLHAQSILV